MPAEQTKTKGIIKMGNLISNSKRFLKRNSSTILTCVGVIGVAATAVVSAHDTIKAVKLIKENERPDEELSKKEAFKIAAPAYIPTVVVGLSTIACILGANVLNKKSQASLASAYALIDSSFKEYRNKAKELYGEEADKKIKEEIMEERYDESLVKDLGREVFFDFYGLQFFNSTIEKVLWAEEEVNNILKKNGYVSLRTFYTLAGADPVFEDDLVGWSINSCSQDGYDHIEFLNEKTKHEDGFQSYSITMICEPVEDYLYS